MNPTLTLTTIHAEAHTRASATTQPNKQEETVFKKTSAVLAAFVLIGICCAFTKPWRPKAHEALTCNVKIEDHRQTFQGKEPVKLTGLFLGDQPITSGVDFRAGSDWIGNLKVGIKNVSDRTIKMVGLVLYLTDSRRAVPLDIT